MKQTCRKCGNKYIHPANQKKNGNLCFGCSQIKRYLERIESKLNQGLKKIKIRWEIK